MTLCKSLIMLAEVRGDVVYAFPDRLGQKLKQQCEGATVDLDHSPDHGPKRLLLPHKH